MNAAGGNALVVYLPEIGIIGNSHMMTLDRNNLKVADVIIKWMERNVKGRKGYW